MGLLNRILNRGSGGEGGGHYGRLYDELIEFHRSRGLTEEEARKAAIGGDYETIGRIERDALLTLGLTGGEFLVDLGCGSGRLAVRLAPTLKDTGRYLGLDVNRSLILEAERQVRRVGAKAHVRFEVITDPILPLADQSVDFITAFSVVTHIDLEDAFNYFNEIRRTLKPEGRALVSYLSTEIEGHWDLFIVEAAMTAAERNARVRNHVMVPGTLNRLAEKAGLEVVDDHPADHPWIVLTEPIVMDGRERSAGISVHLGQSCLILRPAS